MLFLVSWKISCENSIPCWNVFGKMTPEDDLKDAGEHIKIIGRWHRLSGSSGVCICETDNAAALNSWMLNWSPICEISVEPVVDDAGARASLMNKPFFQQDDEDNQHEDESEPHGESKTNH